MRALVVILRIIFLVFIGLWGLSATSMGMVAFTQSMGGGLAASLIGALLLWITYREGKRTYIIAKGEAIKSGEKWSAAFLLIFFVFFGWYIYLCLPYFTR